ncbi:ABC-type spermidine/putrescine transport system, ATPase component [Schinkia azotoformans MEV2011]|uniref:ABC-type spermidine/putrescine transport system, ATPase component n=1 Tax=Schinkia azotoformans MEV2011 TaxID=1348973 RepID=A0A072NGL8_SCHAZ|nr:ABC transporter ATP-binding protein [Schinkia azotoformans]KEF36631.1 ABC-type spermidine/putrescine transport system, ATPase component [Schinkia azotoformans MEV2011]MEC1695596.1 ABC transporter ATP-binding protein [Schinkia azotoformans]MEC1714235.1 ABC transporter ATP-binding protein [Schinkia azotoformans]MEC1723990.1 ABC transporter ATP-binding protein [Schinkia azotoformans]MEC1742450.1 ABC transporter ATP-binding protein [Schinkia azotoformans]
MTILEIKNLTFSFSQAAEPVIKNFSFSMGKGEIVGILGQSGSGKSTLLRLISGLEMAQIGMIKIAGTLVLDEGLFLQPEDRGVGMVFQDYALFPHMNVRDNILFGLNRLPRKDRKDRVKEMLELVKMEQFESRYPHELSGGQQQRIALARALAPKPNLLLMDEPFSNLDADLKESIREDLRTILKKANMTCIIVTHDKNDVDAICDRSIVFGQPQNSKGNKNGKITIVQ